MSNDLVSERAYSRPKLTSELSEVEMPNSLWCQLFPGVSILAGDMWRNHNETAWAHVPKEMIGTTVPDHNKIIIRATAPEGYHARCATEVVVHGDLIWTSSHPMWSAVDKTVWGQYVSDVLKQFQAAKLECVIARPDSPNTVDSRTFAIPPRHRQLFQGEMIRKTDKMIAVDRYGWMNVADFSYLIGQAVPPCDEEHQFLRVCREIDPASQNWFIDEVKGKENGTGSIQDPFPSLDAAEKQVIAWSNELGKELRGIFFSVRGEPLLVYDLPEVTAAPEPPIPAAQVPVPTTPVEIEEKVPNRLITELENIIDDLDQLRTKVYGVVKKLRKKG